MWNKLCKTMNVYEAVANHRCSGYMYAYVADEGRHAVVWYNNGKLYGRYLDDPKYFLRSFDTGREYLSTPKMSVKLAVLIAKFKIYDWWQRR